MVTFGVDLEDVAPEDVEGSYPAWALLLSFLISKRVALGSGLVMKDDVVGVEEAKGDDVGCDAILGGGSCSEGKRADTSVSTIEYPTGPPLCPLCSCVCPEEYRAEMDSRNGRAPSLVAFVTKRFRGSLRLTSSSSEQGYLSTSSKVVEARLGALPLSGEEPCGGKDEAVLLFMLIIILWR